MKLLRLLGASFSLSLRREMAFRVNLFFQLLLTILDIASGFIVLSAVYTQTQELDGWSLGQALVLLGTYQITSGLFQTFFAPNLNWFSAQVNNGTLDNILVQPVPGLYLVSLSKCAPFSLSQAVLGLLVVGLGLHNLGTLPGWWAILSWLFMTAAGMVIIWAVCVLIACLALWNPYIELQVFFSALWQFGRYPVDIYRQPLRFILTFVLPYAFIASFPASDLTGRSGPLLPLIGLATALIAFTLTLLVWKAGLRHYTSASS
jgi:ABC-2 type transport system permease protein